MGSFINKLLGTGKGMGKAEEWGERSLQEATPWGLMGPMGGVTFDPETKLGTATLSSQAQEVVDRLFGRAASQATQAYSPVDAGMALYRDFHAPEINRQMGEESLSRESRALQQGRLGSTGYAQETGAFERAYGDIRRKAMAGAFGEALAQKQAQRQFEIGDIGLAATLSEAPMGLFGTGGQIGQGIGQIASAQGQNIANAYAQNDKMIGDIIGSIAGGWAKKSDRRLKKNINKVGELSSGLNVYTWEWNDKAKKLKIDDQETIGVMAQEVLKINPNAVVIDSDGYYMVDYSEIG